MPNITQGNRLYLYQLFSREVGVGRQTMLTRMEEVLAADDIYPCDLGCADIRELLEALDDMVRLTVFKKGRAYATVVAQPAWDELLARMDAEPTEKKAGPAPGGPKTWKHKRAAKDPRPAKPRPHGRPKPEPVAAPESEAAAAAESASLSALEPEAETADKTAPEQGREPEPGQGSVAESEVLSTDRLEPKPVAETESGAGSAPSAGSGAEHEPDSAAEPKPEPESEPAAGAGLGSEPTAEVGHDTKHEVESVAEQRDERAAAPERNAEPARAVPDAAYPTISLTVTYNPYQDEEPAAARPAEPVESVEASEPVAPESAASMPPASPAPAVPQRVPRPASKPRRSLPQDFSAEVLCRDAQLAALYEVLPFDVDPVALLDEDWRVARSTETYSTEQGVIAFPLRYLRADGTAPARVSMRRVARTTAGKGWALSAVEVGDAAQVDLGGLAAADEGAWSHLAGSADGTSGALQSVSPQRELAQFAVLGPWDRLLSSLARLAEDEPWGAEHALLREYVCVTFHRVQREGKLAVAQDGSLAAFDTGLLTPEAERIFMCFSACAGTIPWEFAEFCTGGALAETLPELPEPAVYVTSLADITLAPTHGVELDPALEKAYGREALGQAVEQALVRARRSYRLATPAYDPQVDQLRLLLPLRLEGGARADHALVLMLRDKSYRATAVLSLDRARACARVVSAELPGWM